MPRQGGLENPRPRRLLGHVLEQLVATLHRVHCPVVEPPVKVKVEYAGAPSDEENVKFAEEIRGRTQRQLRFKAEVVVYSEGDLPAEYGPTGKAKLPK